MARRLRATQTDAERRLWAKLRNRQLGGYKFVRQEPIERYVVDFVCREARLIIEADGGQHAESARDIVRDRRLAALGYRVLRFWNLEILQNTEGVLDTITAALRLAPFGPSPQPSPRKRGEGVGDGAPL